MIDTPGLWETRQRRALHTFMFLPPFLGPTGTLLVHRLAYTHPTPWTTQDLAAQLGLPARRLLDSLDRAAMFNIIFINSHTIEIPTRLGPLPPPQLRKLPDRLSDLHNRLLDKTPVTVGAIGCI
ncbi:MAG: hypothetical protein GY926_19045 [bacterium]|nr:hypothetical protein [bacterium]